MGKPMRSTSAPLPRRPTCGSIRLELESCPSTGTGGDSSCGLDSPGQFGDMHDAPAGTRYKPLQAQRPGQNAIRVRGHQPRVADLPVIDLGIVASGSARLQESRGVARGLRYCRPDWLEQYRNIATFARRLHKSHLGLWTVLGCRGLENVSFPAGFSRATNAARIDRGVSTCFFVS